MLLFNGRDGEWLARVAEAGKRGGVLVCEAQTRPLHMPPDLWLLFAPIKKARTDFIVEKAVELGVARVMPVQTAHTNSERIRQDRLQAHAVEAAEQCGGDLRARGGGAAGAGPAAGGVAGGPQAPVVRRAPAWAPRRAARARVGCPGLC